VTHRRALRATAFGSAVVAATALIIVVILAITYVRRPLPERGGNVSLPGLQGKVTVLRDDRAVPQIYADNSDDLFRVQGYVNAQDRFFQMDLDRHITAGRLSEMVGKNDDALEADKTVRTLGWRLVAQQEYTKASPSTKAYLEAYAAGVNAYIDGRSPSELSVSYTLLGRANKQAPIEPWTPVDSLAWLKAMAWDLRSNYDEELTRARAVTTVHDIDRVDQLYPPYADTKNEPIIPGPTGNDTAKAADDAKNAKNSDTGTGGTGSGTGTSSGTATPTSTPTTTKSSASLIPQALKTKKPKVAKDPVRSAIESDAAQKVFTAADSAINAVPDLVGTGGGIGSNSWVVSGDLTANGEPLLANDPHLKVSLPGVWTQVGLHCTTVNKDCPFDVAGFGFAGMPGVVIGHNAQIAWGMTNLYPDVTDFYLEKIVGDEVEKDGKLKPLTTRPETIKVAGSSPVTITVRSTSHGPLLSDALGEVAEAGGTAPVPDEKLNRNTNYAVSLAWTALQPGHAMDAMLELDVATNFKQFQAAALKLDAPAQNLIYADEEGNIGYQAPGRIPVRGPGLKGEQVPSDGTWPHPGWDSAYDWKGTVPLKDLPWVENPKEGFIVAANQEVTGPGGVKITEDWDYGYRSERIRDLLTAAAETTHRLTVADMRVIQNDTRNGIAAVLVPLLLKTTGEDKFTEEAVDLLRGWDYTQPTNSAAAAYFNQVWVNILNLTFADELPEGFKPDGGDRWFAVVQSILNDEKDPWWDDRGTTDVTESRDEVLRRALASARLQLTAKLGKDPKRWQWGKLHQVTLEQTPIGTDGPSFLSKLFNRGPYPAPGGSSIVNAFSWDASSGSFDVTAAPSMRMIIDLGNLDNSRWVEQTGISGHPGDSHYDDQISTWLHGKDYAWPFSAGAVKSANGDEQDFSSGAG
jgi:penicillin amidase